MGLTLEARVSSRMPALALTLAERTAMAELAALTEKRAAFGVVFAREASKERVRRLPLTVAPVRLAV